MNEVIILGKLANKITTNTFKLLFNEKQLFKCIIKNKEMYKILHKYLHINDIIAIKGHLEVINNEMFISCDKVTICNKESDKQC